MNYLKPRLDDGYNPGYHDQNHLIYFKLKLSDHRRDAYYVFRFNKDYDSSGCSLLNKEEFEYIKSQIPRLLIKAKKLATFK